MEAQDELHKSFDANTALADSLDPNSGGRWGIRRGFREEIYTAVPDYDNYIRHLPYPGHMELDYALLGNIYSDLFNPVFERYEMLEKVVESHRSWNQSDFRW